MDGAGRRVGRRELASDGTEVSFRGWIYRDFLRPIAEVDKLGNVVARYVYEDGYGADQNGLAQLALRVGMIPHFARHFAAGSNVPTYVEYLDSVGNVVQTHRIITDQVGSVIFSIDVASGSVIERVTYEPFGETLGRRASDALPFGFQGGLYDSDTNLVRLGARDLLTSTGIWTARDPTIFWSGDLTLQGFVAADPVNTRDASGLFGLAGFALGAGIDLGLQLYKSGGRFGVAPVKLNSLLE